MTQAYRTPDCPHCTHPTVTIPYPPPTVTFVTAPASAPPPARSHGGLYAFVGLFTVAITGLFIALFVDVVSFQSHVLAVMANNARQARIAVRARPQTPAVPVTLVASPPSAAPASATPLPVTAAPAPARAPTTPPAMPAAFFHLAAMGVHQPVQLLQIARSWSQRGFEMPVHTTTLSRDQLMRELEASVAPSAEVAATPLTVQGRSVGVRFDHVPAGSLLETIGLRDGDVVVSINNWDVPSRGFTIPAPTTSDGLAVLELVRRGRREVLVVQWPTAEIHAAQRAASNGPGSVRASQRPPHPRSATVAIAVPRR